MKYIKLIDDKGSADFILEYIEGIELFDALRQIGLLGTYDS